MNWHNFSYTQRVFVKMCCFAFCLYLCCDWGSQEDLIAIVPGVLALFFIGWLIFD